MSGTHQVRLQLALEDLQQATLDHALWRDRLLRVLSRRRPSDPDDFAPDAHRRCRFGQWYFEQALPELRALPSFAMIGGEHEHQHRIAARLLQSVAAGAQVAREDIEDFEEASARFSFALYFVRRELELALHSRDSQTDAHSSGEMMRDLREWHALSAQPGRQCCLAMMGLDDQPTGGAATGEAASARDLAKAVKIVAAHLRLSDRVFRYDGNKFLVRLSGTDLAAGRTVVLRLRDAVARSLAPAGAGDVTVPRTASFGIAMLDPQVDVLESLDRAEQALTLAKATGRSRMVLWDPSVTTHVRLRRLEPKDIPG